ncbi:hypothetical protein PR001_g24595 [Phytophthora rubi]|uniref:Uncharacterized protein n=1 Tax=Phytophthora rubi TaxID=129364 RepID=A0A6A3IGN6_9STRA|nr:hypothetical protein PR001_g24595 [Phytophthora rubi]
MRGSLPSCFSLRIGSTWPIVLASLPLRWWVPCGIAKSTLLAPATNFSRCDIGLGTSTASTFDRVGWLAQARRSATSVPSCSCRTPVWPANATKRSSRGAPLGLPRARVL